MRSLATCALFLLVGCGLDGDAPDGAAPDGGHPDLVRGAGDLAPPPCSTPNPCGDCDPGCRLFELGPDRGHPFPLASDEMSDPREEDRYVSLDRDDHLTIVGRLLAYSTWVANARDWNRGTISYLDEGPRERARYLTVTCSSLPLGGPQACDGQAGCCALDDPARWRARRGGQAEPPHQAAETAALSPSRTAVDFDGSVWVANRTPGGQSSLTKIAGDERNCIDRNGNRRIDTSRDVNSDGLIETDCNQDGMLDDIAGVKAKPCLNGQPQEFYGLDDECVLFTVNVGDRGDGARAVALGPAADDFGPSDVWAATSPGGALFRINGPTGRITDERRLPNGCDPFGMVVDSAGVGWVACPNGPLAFFDARKGSAASAARLPMSGPIAAWGLALDRDQNVWLGDSAGAVAWRYAPERTGMLAALGQGHWTRITDVGKGAGATGAGRGIALDARTANSYFAWLALDGGFLVRLPASEIVTAQMDQQIDGASYPAVALPGYTASAVGVEGRTGNLWVIDNSASTAIRVVVDANGAASAPDLMSPPGAANRCPAGSRCALRDNQMSDPGTDAYSNFTTSPVRNCVYCNDGSYSYVVPGCPGRTRWYAVVWDADIPTHTGIAASARSGQTPTPDPTWGAWTPDFNVSPADLVGGSVLTPNGVGGASLQVDFRLWTADRNSAPTLRGFAVAYRCDSQD